MHSIIATDFMFIPSQFATNHFRRRFVSGSFVSMDPNEYDIKNNDDNKSEDDIDTDDDTYDSEVDSNLQQIADNNFTLEEKQSAFFEQVHGQNKTVRCLSSSELKNVMDEILGNYSSCSNQVKKTINAIMLSLNEMSITDGTSNGMLASDNEHNSDGMMLESINNLIHEHKNSFLPSKNNFNTGNSIEPNYLMHSKNHFRTHKK